MIATQTTTASRLEARSRNSDEEDDDDRRAAPRSRARPSSARATCPPAATNMTAQKTSTPIALGSSPSHVEAGQQRHAGWPSPSSAATTAAATSAGGRSPGASGSSARAHLGVALPRSARSRGAWIVAARLRAALAATPTHAAPVDRGAQRARRRLGVVAPRRSRARRRSAARPPSTTAPTVSGSMPPMANHGTSTCERGVAQRLDADRRAPGLGRRGVHRADGDVVGAAAPARLGLLHRVRREPDDRVVADELARAGDGHVVLADVHAVGAAGGREVGAVVEHEQRAGGVAALARALGRGQQLVVGGVLVAQLEEVGAAAPARPSRARAIPPRSATKYRRASRRRARRSTPTVSQAVRATIGGQREPVSFGLRGRHHGRRPSGADPGHAGEARGHDIPQRQHSYDVAVVGGGIVGLAVAWRARAARAVGGRARPRRAGRGDLARGRRDARAGRRGRRRRARRCSSSGCAARARWPAFAAELGEVSGVDVGYRDVRHAACSPAIATRPRRSSASATLRERFGLRVERAAAQRARAGSSRRSRRRCAARCTCPTTTPSTRAACAPRSRAPRERAGAVLRAGVEVDDLAALPAEQVVVAAGPWSGAFGDEARVRPVKGQSLRLRDPSGPGLLRTRRALGPAQPRLPRAARRRALRARRDARRSAASTPR